MRVTDGARALVGGRTDAPPQVRYLRDMLRLARRWLAIGVAVLAFLAFLASCGGVATPTQLLTPSPTAAPVTPTSSVMVPVSTATPIPARTMTGTARPQTVTPPHSTAIPAASTTTVPIAAPTATPLAPLYTANFATWFAGEATAPYPSRSGFDPTSGEYSLALTDPARQYGAFRYGNESPRLAEFRLDVDARAVAGPDGGGYGVVFRAVPPGPGEQAVAQQHFFVTTDGRFFLTQIDAAGRGTALASPTAAPAIKPGTAVNHLTVVCKSDRITLMINGETVGTYGSAAPPGGFGVGVSNPRRPAGSSGMAAAFINLRVSTVP